MLCLHVLEHVADPVRALRAARTVLAPGGRIVLYVPQGPWLFSSLDEALGNKRRYDRAALEDHLAQAGLVLQECRPFNRAGTIGWWLNGRLLRRQRISRLQRKVFDVMVPLLRRIDRFLPWPGLGLVAVAGAVPDPQPPMSATTAAASNARGS